MVDRIIYGVCSALLLWVTVGCKSTTESASIDLNRVLQVFDQVTKAPAPGSESDGATEEVDVQPAEEEDVAMTQAFLDKFAAELNSAKLISGRIAIRLMSEGAIEGFIDGNSNGAKDAREARLFTIEIDPEKRRVIATGFVEGKTHRRDHYYHRPRFGYMGYYFLGSMWGRQNRFYSSPGAMRPNYGAMHMTPRAQHTSSVGRARTRATARSTRSARGRGGSRSFRGGK